MYGGHINQRGSTPLPRKVHGRAVEGGLSAEALGRDVVDWLLPELHVAAVFALRGMKRQKSRARFHAENVVSTREPLVGAMVVRIHPNTFDSLFGGETTAQVALLSVCVCVLVCVFVLCLLVVVFV